MSDDTAIKNNYNLLRSVLDLQNNDDVKISKILSEMQRDEIEIKDPSAKEEEETYKPENTEGEPTPPPGPVGGESVPPGQDDVCARFFLAVNPKDRIPEARMKRENIYDAAKLESDGSIRYYKNNKTVRPEQLNTKKGYFYKATVKIPKNTKVTLPSIVYGDWVSSYSTNPPNIHVDFLITDVGQRFVLSPADILLTYIIGIDKPVSAVFKHGPGSPTEIKGLTLSDLKKKSDYSKVMSKIDKSIEKKVKDFLSKDPNPPKQHSDYGKWVKEHWSWFGFNTTPDGKKDNNPCAYQTDKTMNSLLSAGDNTFTSMELRQGACRHKASGFFVIATAAGVPCHYITSDCHAFVELWVPGIGWNIYDLGGCSPPGQDEGDDNDPWKPGEEKTPGPQKPPKEPKTPKPKKEEDLLKKQIDAIVKIAKQRDIKCDYEILINELWNYAKINKKKRYF
jgi:hypothetical protein